MVKKNPEKNHPKKDVKNQKVHMYMIHDSNNLYSSSHDSILTNLQNNKLRSCMAAYIMYIRLISRFFCKTYSMIELLETYVF